MDPVTAPMETSFAGLVLAGGRSRRMGRDKALIEVGGEPLVRRQLRLLEEAGATELWVSVGHRGAPRVESQVVGRANLVRDGEEDSGPAEGLRLALERVRAPWLLALAVDLPALDGAFLAGLLSGRKPGVGVVPVIGSGLEPLCAVYPVYRAGAEIRGWGREKGQAVRRLAATGLEGGWMRAWPLDERLAGKLTNWNAPGDWGGR